MVYFAFMITMAILMFKSTFSSVGIDNSKQFEPKYITFMMEKIIRAFIEQENDKRPGGIYDEDQIINKK